MGAMVCGSQWNLPGGTGEMVDQMVSNRVFLYSLHFNFILCVFLQAYGQSQVFILRKSSKHKTLSPLRRFLLGKASLPARFACLRSLSSMAGELAIATCFGLRTFTFQPNSHKPTICGEYQHDVRNMESLHFLNSGLGFYTPCSIFLWSLVRSTQSHAKKGMQ